MTIEIFDSAKKLVRRYSSDDKPEPIDPMLNVPLYWIRPPSIPGPRPVCIDLFGICVTRLRTRWIMSIRSRPFIAIRRVIRWDRWWCPVNIP